MHFLRDKTPYLPLYFRYGYLLGSSAYRGK
nr:MAG TPA: hypothetical protein [Caudoviricetes sp.]